MTEEPEKVEAVKAAQADGNDEGPGDARRPLVRALRLGAVVVVTVSVLSLLGWGWAADLPGLWGALIGAAVGGGFVLSTAVVVLLTESTSPATTGAAVLGSSLAKIVLVALVFWALSGMDFYSRPAFLVTAFLALIAALGAELYGVVTSGLGEES